MTKTDDNKFVSYGATTDGFTHIDGKHVANGTMFPTKEERVQADNKDYMNGDIEGMNGNIPNGGSIHGINKDIYQGY